MKAKSNIRHAKPEDKELIKTAKVHEWDFEGKEGCWRMKWHCGLFLWKKNDHTFKMLDMWYKNCRTQIESNPKKDWPYDWPSSLWYWDTFAFFNTNYNIDYGVKIKEIHAKWNYVKGYRLEREKMSEDEIVFWHYTIPNDLVDRSPLDDPDIRNTIGNFKLIK